MVPDLDLQLQVSLKALADNVAPAVDPSDKVATEQLGLVMATLNIVRSHLPIQRRFVRRLLEDAIGLADAVSAEVADDKGLKGAADAARAALADPELEADELEAVRADLTSRTVEVISESSGESLTTLGKIVLSQTRLPIERMRSWFLASGFDKEVTNIRPVQELI